MKNIIIRDIALDIKRTGVQVRVPARQGDSLVHKYIISLYCGGQRLSITDAAQARVIAALPDARCVYSDCTVECGRFVFTPGCEFHAAGGSVICRLCLRGVDGAELYSPAFAIENEPVESFSGTEALEESNLSQILRGAIEARDACLAAADIAARQNERPVLLSTVTLSDPTSDGEAFSIDAPGTAEVTKISNGIIGVRFAAPLKRLIVTSRTPTLPERLTGINLEMRANGGEDVCGQITGFHSYLNGYRYGEMCVDTVCPWESFSSVANLEGAAHTFSRNAIVRIDEVLAGVRSITDITLTCAGKLTEFPPMGTFKIYGIRA